MNYVHSRPTTDGLAVDLLDRLTRSVGVSLQEATTADWLTATAKVVRDRIAERWHETNAQTREQGLKQVSYLSMEFLMARNLENALMATALYDECRNALAGFGVDLRELVELEPEPGLGNGGLGRLAACFLDSMACLGLPATGYGIRYEFGMFRQDVADGWQVERPDDWLNRANPWEYERPDRVYMVRFGGRVEHTGYRAHWLDTEDVYAVAYDTLVPGHGHDAVNTLRLWSAKPVEPIDLGAFNRGDFVNALAPKVRSKTVCRVLYPDDSTAEGRELRLRQEHFFVSASIQDILARFREEHDDWSALPDKAAIHLNDTHPALAPAELMRLLVDEHRLEWDEAWALTSKTFSYTNHTLMPEALEVWPCELLQRVLPRHLEIITEINERFLASLPAPVRQQRGEGLSVVGGGDQPTVNMGRFSVLASHRVNGVSKLHSDLVRDRLFGDFSALYPDRFANVTNGITQRRWLVQSNPGLSALIDETIGPGWRYNLDQLAGLMPLADEGGFCERLRAIKADNKSRLAALIAERLDIEVDPAALFDVQVKRIHEYKRQLLNVLGVIARWNAIKAEPTRDWVPRVVIIAGKAAPSYWLAKLIIKLAHDVADRINADPQTGELLKLVFMPNYNVSLAERIIPAADLSQQISLAGTEASGTGNMKLALNGALTLGTEDGANVEIAEAVGSDNIFTFGLTVAQVTERKAEGYRSRAVYEASETTRRVLDQIASGEFSPEDPERFKPIVDVLLDGGDPYMVLGDFASYRLAQARVDAAWGDQKSWSAKAARNIAGMGPFSSDRAIRDYTREIWNADLL